MTSGSDSARRRACSTRMPCWWRSSSVPCWCRGARAASSHPGCPWPDAGDPRRRDPLRRACARVASRRVGRPGGWCRASVLQPGLDAVLVPACAAGWDGAGGRCRDRGGPPGRHRAAVAGVRPAPRPPLPRHRRRARGAGRPAGAAGREREVAAAIAAALSEVDPPARAIRLEGQQGRRIGRRRCRTPGRGAARGSTRPSPPRRPRCASRVWTGSRG